LALIVGAAALAVVRAAVAGLTGVRNIRDDIEIGCDADPIDVDVLVQDALDRYALTPDGSAMSYGHAERNLALIRQLEAETRKLPGDLDQRDRSNRHGCRR
jgi:hypothetical protein